MDRQEKLNLIAEAIQGSGYDNEMEQELLNFISELRKEGQECRSERLTRLMMR